MTYIPDDHRTTTLSSLLSSSAHPNIKNQHRFFISLTTSNLIPLFQKTPKSHKKNPPKNQGFVSHIFKYDSSFVVLIDYNMILRVPLLEAYFGHGLAYARCCHFIATSNRNRYFDSFGVMSYCKFCVYTHQVNSKFTIWHLSEKP